MKNSLLAMLALCGATAFTMPSWAQVEDPTLTFADPDLDAIKEGAKEVYYVYHVGTGHFMTSGNGLHTWGTDLVVAEQGREVTLTYGKDYELSARDKSDPEYSDAASFRLSMMDAPSNGGFHEIFLRQADLSICVDHNKQGHILWDIMPAGDGLYNIRLNYDDPIYGGITGNPLYTNTLMGVNYTGGAWLNYVSPLIVPGSAGYENAGLEWKFVEPEVYEAYTARKNVLKPQIDAAIAAGYPGVTEYETLYNSADATPEALTEAAEELAAAVLAYSYDSASPENPMDVTSLMQNPSFVDANGSATTSGWSTWRANNNNNFQAQAGRPGVAVTTDGSDHPSFFERWTPDGTPHGDYYVQQTLTDIPDGKYALSAYIMSNQTADNGGASGLFLYGSSLTGEVTKEADVPSPDGNAYAAPYTVEFTVLGGQATVGMRASGYAGNWSYVADFTLKYLGADDSKTLQQVLQQRIDEAQKLYDEELSFPQHSQAGDDKFNALMELCREAVANTELDGDSLMALMDAITLRVDSLRDDIEAYETLQSKTQELSDAWDNSVYFDQDFLAYEEFLLGLEEVYDSRTFDPAEIDSIQPRADRLWRQCVLEAMATGELTNVTGMLTNPNFDGSNNGWTKTGNGDFKNDGTRVTEVWNGKTGGWEVYQELTGLPQGSYKITAQAFYSPSSTNNNGWHENYGVEGDQTNDIHAFLFANDASKALLHVMTFPQDEKLTDDMEEITWGGESLAGKFVAHGKASAQAVFEADPNNYLNEVVGYVGEDGVLRIGMRMEDVITWTGSWVVFDNFQVTYLGADDMSGASSALNALIEEATKLLNAESLSTTETRDALNKAIEDATAAAAGDMTPEVYAAQTEALNAAMEAEREAVSEATTLETKVNNENLKFQSIGEGSYVAYEGTEAYDELETIVMDVITTIDNEGIFASREEIKNYNDAINAGCAKMMSALYDFSVASKDAPVEVTNLIYNPSFQLYTMNDDGTATLSLSNDGWTIEGGGGATSGLNFEVFDDSTDIHQTLHGLPAGYYRLVFNGFYRAGDITPAALARRDSVGGMPLNAEVYLKSGENQWTETLHSIFDEVYEGPKYDDGDSFISDTLLTDMADMVYRIIVNNVAGARAAFEDGRYESSFSFQVAEGEEPVLGMRKMSKIMHDWTCIDNFRLYYLGAGDENRPDGFEDSIEDVAEGTATVVSSIWATLNGMKIAEPKQGGIYIRIDKMSDGTTKAVKVLVR